MDRSIEMRTLVTGESNILVVMTIMNSNTIAAAVQQAVFITQAVNLVQPDDARLTGELTL